MTEPLESAYSDAAESPGFALWRVTTSWQGAVRAALAPYDLTHVQFVLLASLAWMDRDVTVSQRDLADLAGTDVMMTSQVVRTLERKGLVVRSAHPTDGRARALAPTARGRELASRANSAVESADDRYFDVLGSDRDLLLRFLKMLDRAGAAGNDARTSSKD